MNFVSFVCEVKEEHHKARARWINYSCAHIAFEVQKKRIQFIFHVDVFRFMIYLLKYSFKPRYNFPSITYLLSL